MPTDKRVLVTWLLIAFVSFVFLQSLFFKFQGHEETQIIFGTISDWMADIGLLAWAAPLFNSIGGYAIGSAELVAVILLWIPNTRTIGATLGLVVISGAIFFHLFTPLGVNRVINEAGDTDGGVLFYMACGVWVCCALILYLRKPKG
ncbi:MAG TPA: hypothetical protein DCY55_10480 [Gammaproteobacteria bacterium]|jgi:hypothetical protein|nr:hypothetical protein [Pseudomonadota bacterium]HAY46691.1 hypothetical protein [Gammaproteobacteria bacterium]